MFGQFVDNIFRFIDTFVIFPDTKLQEYKVDELEVTKIATEVAVARREAEIVSTLKVFSI